MRTTSVEGRTLGRQFTHFMLAFVPAIIAAGCVIGEVGSGRATTESLDLGPFTSVDLTNFVDVTVSAGATISGTLTCDDNLIDNFEIEVRSNSLRIGTRPGQAMRPRVDCEVVLTTTGLEEISNSGSGNLVASGLAELVRVRASGSGNVDVASAGGATLDATASGSGSVSIDDASAPNDVTLRVDGSGDVAVVEIDADTLNASDASSGNIEVSGSANGLDVTVSGSGNFDGEDLAVGDAAVALSGSGNARFTATGTVSGTVSGSGDLTVDGPATVSVTTTGSGQVR